MPTGYTYRIEEDPSFTFERYVWLCARAFIPQMREDPMTDPVPERFEVDSYHLRRLVDAEEELGLLKALSPEEFYLQAARDYEQHYAQWAQNEAKRQVIHARYLAMEAEIVAWEPPEPYHSLREFMLSQLRMSVHQVASPYTEPTKISLEEAAERLAERIKWAKDDVRRAKDQLEENRKHTEQFNVWLAGLRAEVPQP